MPLKYKFTSAGEVPAELKSFYVERDGAFVLDAEGVVDKAKHEEFRQNNITLANQLKRFEGIDPDAVRQLAADKQRLEEAAQLKAGEFEKVLETRTKAAVAAKEKEFAPKLAELDAVNGRMSAMLIDDAAVAEATKRGLRATALADLKARARQTFKLVNGVPQAFDGDTLRVGHDGVTPLTLAEWVDRLVGDAPHLFEANAGGGAVGSGGGATGNRSVRNPFLPETRNVTEQMKLIKTDPALAARMQAAA